MKKAFLLFFALAITSVTVNAQYVSLADKEFTKLKELVNTDTAAGATFKYLRSVANNALAEQPDPIERISSEGKLAGDPAKIKTGKSLEDARKIYALALVYRIDGNKACLNKAAEYLLAWASVNKSCGDPIDETRLDDFIFAYDIIRNDIAGETKTAIDSWLQAVADGEINSKYMAPGRGTAVNNWNSHRIKIITMIAYTLRNEQDEMIAQEELKKQIAINLYADGSGRDFKDRDALHYHIYTLEPLITAATVIYRATGKDYFNYESETGSSIKKSVDFLVPFVTGEKTHAEFLNSHVAFDMKRANNNEKDYQPGNKFNPVNGMHVLEQASYFSHRYMAPLQQAALANNVPLNDWELTLNKARKPSGLK